MKQWHPVFVRILRPVVEAYYEVHTTVPVGDAPREADIVLLRRTSRTPPPFRGLWRHLTAENVPEFKGPSVSPRRRDIDRLIELGLGIARRLDEESAKASQRGVRSEDVSFWYLANHLGIRFRREAERKLGRLEPVGPGLWRGQVLLHLVYLVSSVHLPVEEDCLPLHVIGHEPPAVEREVAKLVAEQPDLQSHFGGWMAALHPAAWKEVQAMARASGRGLKIDLRPAIQMLGLKQVIEQVGMDQVIEAVGEKEVIKHFGIEGLLASLSAKERRELKRLLLEEEKKG